MKILQKNLDSLAKSKKFEEVNAKALVMKPNSIEANYLNGLYLSRKVINVDEQLKALKNKKSPADLANVKKLNADKLSYSDPAIKNFEYLASIYRGKKANLTSAEKDRYKSTLTYLIYYYSFKKMDVKSKEAEASLNELKKMK